MKYTQAELDLMRMAQEHEDKQEQEAFELEQNIKQLKLKLECLRSEGRLRWCDEHNRIKTSCGSSMCAPCEENAKKTGETK